MWINLLRLFFAPSRLWRTRLVRTPTVRQKLGESAEEAACAFLQQQGLRISARNVHCGRAEFDVLAWEGDCPVVVEVRYRGKNAKVRAHQSLSPKKTLILREGARALMREQGWRQVRIDAVFIDEGAPLRWQKNAVVLHDCAH